MTIGPRTKIAIAAVALAGVGVWWKRKQSRIGICVEAADGRTVCAGDIPVDDIVQNWNPFSALADWFKSSSSNQPLGGGVQWGSQGEKPSEWWSDPPR